MYRRFFIYLFFAWFITSVNSGFVLAEGTKELMPSYYSYGRVEIYPSFSMFAYYNCPETDRLNISISEPGETIYFGFGDILTFDQSYEFDLKFRIRDPNGNIVYSETDVPLSGQGHINTYNEAVNGPSIISTGGYNALSYVTQQTGDYYIEFAFEDYSQTYRRELEFFDLTVVGTDGNVKLGRLWSKAWQLTVTASPAPNYFDNPFDATMFIYADDGIVTSVDFNGMRPYVFIVNANETGCYASGNLIEDRKSIPGYHNYPQYKIFLNDPDSNSFPSGVIGSIEAASYLSGTPLDYCINVTVNKKGVVEVLLEMNGTPGFQSGTQDRMIVYDVEVGQNCIPFDGIDGLGNIINGCTYMTIHVSYFNGMTHLPITDVEYNENGFIVRVVRPYVENNVPALFWDDSNIEGYDVYPQIQAPGAGCIDVTGCHKFFNFFGDTCTINTWWFAASDIKDSIIFNLYNLTVDANINTNSWEGNDIYICSSQHSVQLAGEVTYADGGVWTGGTGTFSPDNFDLNAIYTLSPQEIANGYVTLTLTSTGNHFCDALDDYLTIHLIDPVVIDAGPDQSICLNDNGIFLNGSTSYLTNTVWSGGNGTYSPNMYSLSVEYNPDSYELANGSFQIYLHGEDDLCGDQIDSVNIQLEYLEAEMIASDITCSGQNDGIIALLNINSNVPPIYSWSNGESGVKIENQEPGNYCVTVTANNICALEFCEEILEPDSLSIEISKTDLSCNGVDMGSIIPTVSGGTQNYSYSWNTGSNYNYLTQLDKGAYSLTVTDANGCTGIRQIELFKKGNPPILFNAENTVGCYPFYVKFNEEPFISDYMRIWNFGDGTTDTSSNAVHVYYESGIYSVELTITNSDGCDSTYRIEDYIEVYDHPVADLSIDPKFTDIFHPEVHFYNHSSEDAVFINWNISGSTFYMDDDVEMNFKEPGIYIAELVAINVHGCSDTAWGEATVNDIPVIYVPNAFTPDGDGKNEIFLAKGHAIDETNYLFVIYDRWGEIIFESDDLYAGWNGKYNNRPVPTGVYTWMVDYSTIYGKRSQMYGSVTLIR